MRRSIRVSGESMRVRRIGSRWRRSHSIGFHSTRLCVTPHRHAIASSQILTRSSACFSHALDSASFSVFLIFSDSFAQVEEFARKTVRLIRQTNEMSVCSAKYGSSVYKVMDCLKEMSGGKGGSLIQGKSERSGGSAEEEADADVDEVEGMNVEVLSLCLNVLRELEEFRTLLMHQRSSSLSLSLSLSLSPSPLSPSPSAPSPSLSSTLGPFF